jgi:hypothetical protein
MRRWVGRGRRCRDCDAVLEDTRVAELAGRHGPVHVLLRDYPVRACPQGHRRRQHPAQPAPELPGRWKLTAEAAESTIGVEVTGPAVRCEGCGRLVGDPRCELLVSPVPDALIDAFDRAGIAP